MFKENFVRLCAKRNESPSAVCIKLGMGNSTYSGWREDTVPRRTALIKIADYFGVTVESLLDDSPPELRKQLDDEEVRQRVIQILNSTDDRGRRMLLRMLEAAQKAYNDEQH